MNILIYHIADPDGWMSRAVIEHYVDIDRSIGWDFGDKVPTFSDEEIRNAHVIVVDLPVSLVKDIGFSRKITWIDHHKSEIEKWPHRSTEFDGIQVDGVAACRLAWWYYCGQSLTGRDALQDVISGGADSLPYEPAIIHMVGLRDVWKHKGTIYEQDCNRLNLALLSRKDLAEELAYAFECGDNSLSHLLEALISDGARIEPYDECLIKESADRGARIITAWDMQVLTLNTQARGSKMLEAKALELAKSGQTVDALMVYGVASDGMFNVSWYHAPGQTHRDLSVIAKRYGGGGHAGACGARMKWQDMGFIVA